MLRRLPTRAAHALRRATVPLALVLAASACGDGGSTLFPGTERMRAEATLSAARERWEAQRTPDYDFTMEWSCECLQAGPATVQVRGGVPVSITGPDGTPRDPRRFQHSATIDALFDRLQETLRADPHRFSASYDRQAGFPTQVRVDGHPTYVDDEYSVAVRDYRRFAASSLTTARP